MFVVMEPWVKMDRLCWLLGLCTVLRQEAEQIKVKEKVSNAKPVKRAGQKKLIKGRKHDKEGTVEEQKDQRNVLREKKKLVTFCNRL